MRTYQMTVKQCLWKSFPILFLSCIFLLYGYLIWGLLGLFVLVVFDLLVIAITFYAYLNYVLNDYGIVLEIDKTKRTLRIVSKKYNETVNLTFDNIDCIRIFHHELIRKKTGEYYYRIRLKEDNSVIYISKLTIQNLEEELEGVLVYYSEKAFLLIPRNKTKTLRQVCP